jgi:single-strand DNA-binding protein
MNKAILVGNLTRDVELRNTASGKIVASFGLATNERYTDTNGDKVEKVEFHNIVAWGKTAELLAKYCSKGKKVLIVGKLQTQTYEGQDGVKRYKTEIIANEIEFLSPKEVAKQGEMNENEPDEKEMKEDEEIKIENIPF